MGILGLVQVKGRRQKKNGRRRILGRYASWFSLMLCIAVALLLASCGGSGSNNRVLTPTGTSTVTIAGSTSTGAQTTSFTLVVQ
jgi:ABC-type phosphate transport system substrate-binding protein